MAFWTSDTRAAVVGVVGGILGAVIGGLSAYLIQDNLTEQQVTAAREERRAGALGSARLMQTEFRIRYDDLASTLSRMRYPTRPLEIPRALPQDARRRVAERMKPPEWEKVVRAEIRIGRVDRLLDRRKEDDKKFTLDDPDLPVLKDYIARFKAATDALAAFAESQEP